MSLTKKTPWYIAGLHFECRQCGGCCSGPGEGYIWITREEIELLADFLEISVEQLRRQYLKRVGLRTSIIEHSTTKDCIFLQKIEEQKKCVIYPVRPGQCRTWPFWSENLSSAGAWNTTAQKCPGINRGKFYSFEQIKKIQGNKNWWQDIKKKTSAATRHLRDCKK
ncbi:MAG: YkgJ family cysteine cluster protein [Sedimentisphaerales bacterium]|nr:YkgJ family cysteine cluster protein [Sedimentisphaerales bacterium]